MNRWRESDELKRKIMRGDVNKGSIIFMQHPSGNKEAVRYHRTDKASGNIVSCNMCWDNGATEYKNISGATVLKILEPPMNI